MSLELTHTQLMIQWLHLHQKWQTTASLWNDTVRWQFEQEYWQPFDQQIPAFLTELEKLSQAIAQAQQNVR